MLERLGIPDFSRHRRFVAAVSVDAIGSGVFMPVSLLYFIATTSLSITQVGAALSVAAVVSLPLVLGIGHVVDRIGAKTVLIAANAVQALGFLGYTLASSFLQVVVLTSLVGLGQSAFWASYSPLVAALSRPGEREKWFGFLGALRNVGFAVGGLVAGIVVTIGTPGAYRTVVVVNALSYAASLTLLLGVRAGGKEKAPEGGQPHWSIALRDRPFRLLVLSNLAYALCGMALNVAMPVYAAEVLRLPGWVTGAIFTLNTILVGVGQGLVVRWMTGRVRYRLVLLANLVFAAGFLLMAGVSWLSTSLATMVILGAVVVYTFGELLGGPVLTTIAVDSRPAHLRGRYMAFYQLSWLVAGIIAPSSFTWLLTHGESTLWFALVAVTVVGGLLGRLMGRTLPVAAATVTNDADPPTAVPSVGDISPAS